ncbi:MAG: LLM class F420-dependent oxidoreductase, partial [Actinobacteria bacterium]|nr:LLM class F420-dependent oxidoreductase [Actinomycetota bacterium]
MRFSYAEPMIDPTFYAPLATAAEQAGYDSMVVPDSIMYPAESDSTYPYTDDGNREF